MDPLELALDYSKGRAWPVFPCRAQDEETTDWSTGEITTLYVKSPYTPNGFRGATKSERLVRELWRRHPNAMVGIPTGAPIGCWVLDIDTHKGGGETLAALLEANGELPETLTASTMSGGRHYYFKHVAGVRNRGGLGIGIDVRGDGGYVIAPGSLTIEGGRYAWENDAEPAEAPEWLLELVLPKAAPEPGAYHSAAIAGAGENPSYVAAAVKAELDELAGTVQGGRGEALNRAAFKLGQFVAAGAISRSEAEVELYTAAVANGGAHTDGDKETHRKIKRGLDAGTREPRSIPAPSYQDDGTAPVDVSKLVAKAKEKAERASAESVEDTPEEPPKGGDASAPAAEAKRLLEATPFEWKHWSTLEPREWLYDEHLIRRFVSVTVSPGGVGKTTLSVAEALAMVTGRPLLGVKPPKPLRVWLFNLEDPRDEMEKKLMAACKHFGITADDIGGRLYLDTGREQELVIAKEDRGLKFVNPVIDALVQEIQRRKIDVLNVDPFVSSHRVSENDNNHIDAISKTWTHIADQTNISVELVHHIRKVEGRDATIDDSRGAKAFLDAARSARVLNGMSREDGEAAGLGPGEHLSYFSVTRGKSSMTEQSDKRVWRKRVSVNLENGRQKRGNMLRAQDHVGVATPWAWPDADTIAEAVSDDAFKNIARVLDNGLYKRDVQSHKYGTWAGAVIGEEIGLDPDTSAGKKRIETILKSLEKSGKLKVEDLQDANRKLKKHVKSAGWESRG